MKEIKRPYNAKALTKWSAFRVTEGKEDKVYDLELTPLTELVKQPGYEKFKDRFNWLYKNYSTQNFDLVWKELQDHNEDLKEDLIRQDALRKSEMSASYQMKELEIYFGDIPKWIKELSPEKHALLLDRAVLLYQIEPDYEICKLYLKDIYTVPQRELMDYYEGIPVYYELKPSELNGTLSYNTIVGKAVVVSEYARKLAEQAAIRDASWIAKNCPEFKVAYSIEEILCPEEE